VLRDGAVAGRRSGGALSSRELPPNWSRRVVTAVIVLASLLALALVCIPLVVLRSRASARRIVEEGRRRSEQAAHDARREVDALRQRALLDARETLAAERSRA